jgi:ribosomal protein S4
MFIKFVKKKYVFKFKNKYQYWQDYRYFWLRPCYFLKYRQAKSFKKTYKKKLILKKFVIKSYSITNFKRLTNCFKNKFINFVCFVYCRLDSLAVKSYFSWDLKKARYLVMVGLVKVNNNVVVYGNYVIKPNDILSINKHEVLKYLTKRAIKNHKVKWSRVINFLFISLKTNASVLLRLPFLREILKSFFTFKVTKF